MFIVVGVTGGIAAYKTVHLVRLLVTAGHEVHVIPTEDALRFVGLTTWEAISRHPVTTSVHEDVAEVRHVALGRRADLVIVAPATAHTLASMAAGLAGDLLGTTLLATSAPVVVAPAMHSEMWAHPATRANLATLRSRGVHVVGPDDGPLTGGDAGPGRMSEPETIVAAALAVVPARSDLSGLEVAVSAGGTREPIDPVRFVGNRSSGRQGVALALAAADRGADVTLVAAHVEDGVLAEVSRHPRVRIRRAGTVDELAAAMAEAAGVADVVVMAAAVSDYRAAEVSERKLSKEDAGGEEVTLRFVRTPDIVAGLADRRRPGQTVVAFAAETEDDADALVDRALRKAARKGVDLLVANRVGWTAGFGASENAVVIVSGAGDVLARAEGAKREVADSVWDAVLSARHPR
ncbi:MULTISPECIES: bifunctional phosphopantothenoylcysteine decarboxylase/phosphopantothenate--cysteine ligase CoaBC [Microbacterium]|uniref:Coenzyme A biosynthesis bifunctional protein CoaBC n=1 Tax=Microbacterium wangchenii TaxID=2541726 RepID=A0ABX5SNG1_9MICO|nr:MULTISPECIES: bifunctional phosphopantothenoylcysteine decarboxylase/phosphopantothenate--cysteine ligase CoaBC [Microbacterium]MCK6068390.1 bifunctional phosphopantothenoylcysteine decarboxylase/phosphopantothenate--cysteine ligase CoaBC [Microbacterium sp. EYE_512]QBR87661.1 bifunctional phosphopantothenoylcysteine decarboxylase/phosphopantothenate--cysteine ligase CoaBC [Microbacterium wangchenii]